MSDGSFFRGDSYTLTYTVTRDGEPVDLSNATIRWALSRSVHYDPEITKQSSDKGLFLGQDTGEVVVELAAGETSDLEAPKKYYHELEVTDSDGNVATAATGQIMLRPVVLDPEVTETG